MRLVSFGTPVKVNYIKVDSSIIIGIVIVIILIESRRVVAYYTALASAAVTATVTVTAIIFNLFPTISYRLL